MGDTVMQIVMGDAASQIVMGDTAMKIVMGLVMGSTATYCIAMGDTATNSDGPH